MSQAVLRTPEDLSLPPEQALAGSLDLQPPPLVDRATASTSLPSDVTRRLIGGTSTLGFGIFLERGAGFLANLLAARLAGTSTFGAYSLAISTANNISTYAAGGIGATAARFSGKYPQQGSGYPTLARALAIVSLVSATLAATALWLGAVPIAHLLAKPALTGLLRWAALSAVGIILLECARGFFVGQRRLAALLLLSVVVGGGMLALLPVAAHSGTPNTAIRMVVVQGVVTSSAVVLCLLLARPLHLNSSLRGSSARRLPLLPMLREVWSFGLVQLAGLVGSNLAGLWLTALIARSDTTLVQMSFFTIASQLRNLVGIAPGLLTEGSYAVMADPDGEDSRTPHRVMALCTFASLAVSLLLAAAGIVVIPWVLTLLYGRAYAPAGITVAIALAIAVIHMGNAPAAARLTIVSIRSTGIINTIWAGFVASAATLFFFFGGGAWQAMAIYFIAHMFSSILVLLTLRRRDHIPVGMSSLFFFATSVSATLAVLAVWRGFRPALTLPITSGMFALLIATAWGLYLFGRRYDWLPSAAMFEPIKAGIRARMGKRFGHV